MSYNNSINNSGSENRDLQSKLCHPLAAMKLQHSKNSSATEDSAHDGTKHQAFTRTKSEDTKTNKFHKPENRKFSAPAIFVFPNTESNSNDSASFDEAKITSKNEYENQDNVRHKLSSIGMPGVSQFNFQVIVQELAKTKLFLHSQLKEIENEKAKEMEFLRKENSAQKRHNQFLQIELEKCKVELSRRPSPSLRLQAEDSFEITPASQPAPVTHMMKEEYPDLLQLNEHIVQLQKTIKELISERDSLQSYKEKLEPLKQDYGSLKDRVKILSTCLQDEKDKNRGLEEQIFKMKGINTKLSETVGNLRVKYEELSQEKHALEKSLSLQDGWRRHSGESRHDSSNTASEIHTSNRASSKPLRSAKISAAETLQPLNIAPTAAALNNLSQNIEPKVSNVQIHECPRCLQNFNDESSYLNHLQICIE